MKPQESPFVQYVPSFERETPTAWKNFLEWLAKEKVSMNFFKGGSDKKFEIIQKFFQSIGIGFKRAMNGSGKYISVDLGELKPAHSASAMISVFSTEENEESRLIGACSHIFKTLEEHYYW